MQINKLIIFLLANILASSAIGQSFTLKGKVTNMSGAVMNGATVSLPALKATTKAASEGHYEFTGIPSGSLQMTVTAVGYAAERITVTIRDKDTTVDIALKPTTAEMDEIVVSGTMKEVSRLESPVPVEVYSDRFFRANPTPTIFDALQNVNGVRPQLNCNICNTGDIHINGLEGPYTMILIDGMPIVSGLSTVYGLSGIPQALIDRVEVVKGPASTLYGSEAVGGLINIITKNPDKAPLVAADVFSTSWGEVNADIATRLSIGNKAQALLGINYFNYSNPVDNNKDGFTDVTLQHRISAFNKWNFNRKNNRIFSMAARYVYEDRWGGEMNWASKYRGGEDVYGESIYTSRWELMGTYQLPMKEKVLLQLSANGHDQNSVYGNTLYLAKQYIGFAQLSWFKTIREHDLLGGITYRYTYYDDNTPATASANNLLVNAATHTHLPGAFLQDEITISRNNKILLGIRYDYNSIHGSILSPRVNYKWNSADKTNVLRLGIGNGYRVANVFTEDHAALTGARQVVFENRLKPETSWNGNLNFIKKVFAGNTIISLDATAFYTFFTNKIIANYDADPNKIMYDNLEGYAISRGFSFNADIMFPFGLKVLAGATAMDVYSKDDGVRHQQLFTEKFTCTWNIGYTFHNTGFAIDYTGNVYGPMRLPLLSDTDPRSEYSPWWSIQNIQLRKKIGKKVELYGGVKNLLNWTPNRGNPFIIARASDPFDKNVQFDANGQAMKTAENPYGLTFDPSYVYAPNQGIRGFIGLRYTLR